MSTAGTEMWQRTILRTMLTAGAIAGRPIRGDGATLDPMMAAMLRIIRRMPQPSTEGAAAAEGAAMRANYETAARITGMRCLREVRTEELIITNGPAPLAARRFIPPGERRGTLLYFHGGGFAIGSLDTHDRLCRVLAERTGLAVLSVAYRLAPEHKFPAAADDAVAALEFAAGHEPGPLAIGGDSAGGQLAVVALTDRRDLPVHAQMLLYPVVDMAGGYASEGLFGEGFLLTVPMMAALLKAYVPPDMDRAGPRLSPLRAVAPAVPAVIVAAGFDPLRDQARAYAVALESAGVQVQLHEEQRLIHGFADFAGVVPEARRAVLRAADALRGLMEQRTPG